MGILERELESDLGALVTRMRDGDREAAAAFMTIYGDRVRRRVSGKLSPAMRRLFDSQEILSTVTRRLDRCVSTGGLNAAAPEQLWALVFQIAENSVVDKGRIYRKLQNTESRDQPFADRLRQRLDAAEAAHGVDATELELDAVLRSLPTPLDREILTGWLRGLSYETMSQELGLRVDTLRRRFKRIKKSLRDEFRGAPDDLSE